MATEKISDTQEVVSAGLAANIGTLQRFPEVMGNESLTRELALTRKRFGAAEAHAI
jgi:Delta3,5-Delta2,4-dienoyl-CoA isomerase